FEKRLGQLSKRFRVFHQQDRFGSTCGFNYGCPCSDLGGRLLNSRQKDLKRSPLPWLALHPDVTATLFDHTIDGRETQSRTLSDLLGCKKWFENVSDSVWIDAGSRVDDGRHDVMPRLGSRMLPGICLIQFVLCGLDSWRAAFPHGVPGVDSKIHAHLLDFALIWLHHSQVRAKGCV